MKVKPARQRSLAKRGVGRKGKVVVELSERDEAMLESASSPTSGFRIKKILVPMDFSACAKKALRYAVPLAKEHGAVITLLYVAPVNYAVNKTLEIQMRKMSEENLTQLGAEATSGSVPTKTVVRVGVPVEEIVDVAKSMSVDIIVISTHGHTALRQVFLGSVTEHLVRHAPCPVLVVREHEQEFVAV